MNFKKTLSGISIILLALGVSKGIDYLSQKSGESVSQASPTGGETCDPGGTTDGNDKPGT